MNVQGHHRVRAILEQELPPATLLRGPDSIGKFTLGLHLAAHHGIADLDTVVAREGDFGVETVRTLNHWAYFPPAGQFKVAVLDITGASMQAVHALLKMVEEPPGGMRFILTGAEPIPQTLVSRCRVFDLSPLTVDELRHVLLTQGLSKPVAVRESERGRGQVRPALARIGGQMDTVEALVKAIATRDLELFEQAIADTTVVTRDLLHRWLVEAMTGERVLFTDAQMFGLHTRRALLTKMLLRLSSAPRASARLTVRVALEPFLAT